MRKISGTILVLLGLAIFLTPLRDYEATLAETIQKRFNRHIQSYEDYAKERPIQDDITKQDYELSTEKYKNLAKNFNNEPVLNSSLRTSAFILVLIVGILYIIAGIVLVMNLKWIAPTMGIALLGFLSMMFLFHMCCDVYIDLYYKMVLIETKMNYITGFFKENYYQYTLAAKNKLANGINFSFLFLVIIGAFIPAFYLTKAFYQDEKK